MWPNLQLFKTLIFVQQKILRFEHVPRSAIQTSDQKCGNRTLVLTRSSIFTAIFCLAYNLTGCEIAIRLIRCQC